MRLIVALAMTLVTLPLLAPPASASLPASARGATDDAGQVDLFNQRFQRLTDEQVADVESAEAGELLVYVISEADDEAPAQVDPSTIGLSVGKSTEESAQADPVVCVALVEDPVYFAGGEIDFQVGASCNTAVSYLRVSACEQALEGETWVLGDCDNDNGYGVSSITALLNNEECVPGVTYRTYGALRADFIIATDDDERPSDFSVVCE